MSSAKRNKRPNIDSKSILKILLQRRAQEKTRYKWEHIDKLGNGSSKSNVSDGIEDTDDVGMLFRDSDASGLQPYVKFRRAARAVKAIVQVCQVCREYVVSFIQSPDIAKSSIKH